MIDINKKYRTQNGSKVKLLSTEGEGDFAVVGYVYRHDGTHTEEQPILTCWLINGAHPNLNWDLVEEIDENLPNVAKLLMEFRDWQKYWDSMPTSTIDSDELVKEISDKYEIKLKTK